VSVCISTAAHKLFLILASDASNWSPKVGKLLRSDAAFDEGNLTQLRVAGLIRTTYDKDKACVWVTFTKAGKKLAAQYEVQI